jgi:hypothetical protein
VRCNNGAGKPVASIETDSITACRSVDFNLSSVWREATGRILSGDAALESEPACRYVVLSEAQLLERGTSGDLNLRGNNVDASDLFCDGMFDLTTCSSADGRVLSMPVEWFLTTATPHDGILTCAG